MAKKDVSAIVSGAGFLASVWTAIMAAVRERGGTDEQVHRLAREDGKNLIGKIADLIVGASAKAVAKIVGTFTITCEGKHTASELKALGKYDWSNDWINNDRFPITKHDPMKRTIEFVEFDHDPSSEEVLAELARLGLERPTHEDALYFGIEHPDEQRKRPIVFLHEPVASPNGSLYVVVLDGSASRRYLNLGYFEVGWDRRYVFAGVRTPTGAVSKSA